MAEIIVNGTTAEEERPEPPELHLNFPSKGDVQPEGFESLTLGGEAIIMVRGKVTRAENDPEAKWGPGKGLTCRIITCKVAPIGNTEQTAKTLYPDMKE